MQTEYNSISHHLKTSTALDFQVQDEIHSLKKQMNVKENEFKMKQALLEQEVELLKMQIEESKGREDSLKKMNETIMNSLNDISTQGNQNKILKEIQANYDQQMRQLIDQREKLHMTISNLEGEKRQFKDEINEMRLQIKDFQIALEKEKINKERVMEVGILDRTQLESDLQKQQLATEGGFKSAQFALESKLQELSYQKDKQILELKEQYEEKIRLMNVNFDKEKLSMEGRLQKNMNTIKKYQAHIEQSGNTSMNQSQNRLDASGTKQIELEQELKNEINRLNADKAILQAEIIQKSAEFNAIIQDLSLRLQQYEEPEGNQEQYQNRQLSLSTQNNQVQEGKPLKNSRYDNSSKKQLSKRGPITNIGSEHQILEDDEENNQLMHQQSQQYAPKQPPSKQQQQQSLPQHFQQQQPQQAQQQLYLQQYSQDPQFIQYEQQQQLQQQPSLKQKNHQSPSHLSINSPQLNQEFQANFNVKGSANKNNVYRQLQQQFLASQECMTQQSIPECRPFEEFPQHQIKQEMLLENQEQNENQYLKRQPSRSAFQQLPQEALQPKSSGEKKMSQRERALSNITNISIQNSYKNVSSNPSNNTSNYKTLLLCEHCGQCFMPNDLVDHMSQCYQHNQMPFDLKQQIIQQQQQQQQQKYQQQQLQFNQQPQYNQYQKLPIDQQIIIDPRLEDNSFYRAIQELSYEKQLVEEKLVQLEEHIKNSENASGKVAQDRDRLRDQLDNIMVELGRAKMNSTVQSEEQEACSLALKNEIKFLINKLLKAKGKLTETNQNDCSMQMNNQMNNNNYTTMNNSQFTQEQQYTQPNQISNNSKNNRRDYSSFSTKGCVEFQGPSNHLGQSQFLLESNSLKESHFLHQVPKKNRQTSSTNNFS